MADVQVDPNVVLDQYEKFAHFVRNFKPTEVASYENFHDVFGVLELTVTTLREARLNGATVAEENRFAADVLEVMEDAKLAWERAQVRWGKDVVRALRRSLDALQARKNVDLWVRHDPGYPDKPHTALGRLMRSFEDRVTALENYRVRFRNQDPNNSEFTGSVPKFIEAVRRAQRTSHMAWNRYKAIKRDGGVPADIAALAKGMDEAVASKLAGRTVREVLEASDEELLAIQGVGPVALEKIREVFTVATPPIERVVKRAVANGNRNGAVAAAMAKAVNGGNGRGPRKRKKA